MTPHRTLSSFLAVPVVTLALSGCSDSDSAPRAEQRIGTASDAISGGVLDSSDTAVVGVAHASQFGVGGCTGSLLFANVVLTALHCVADTPQLIDCPSQTFGIHRAQDMYVTTETTYPQSLSGWQDVREIMVSPFTGLCGRDVAILVLDVPMSPSLATPLLPRTTALASGEIYSAVGYGQVGEGGPSGTRYRRDNLAILCVGSECGAPESVYPKEWVGETGVCSGDSGGPALDSEGRVTGVASRGAAMCDQPVYGDVFGHLDWIKESTVYAAGLAGTPPPSWATESQGGEGGGGGSGAGGAAASSGSGFVAGDTENQDFDGELVSSCAMAPAIGRAGVPASSPRAGWLALLGLAALMRQRPSRRRRRRRGLSLR